MTKKKIILTAVILLACIPISYLAQLGHRWISKDVAETRHASAIDWLGIATHAELHRYYGEHGRYPQTLFDLNIPFPGDNATPDMLNEFSYSSDGNSFTLKWQFKYGKRIHSYSEKGEKGEKVTYKYYVDGQLSQELH
jgi:hypothetical protein